MKTDQRLQKLKSFIETIDFTLFPDRPLQTRILTEKQAYVVSETYFHTKKGQQMVDRTFFALMEQRIQHQSRNQPFQYLPFRYSINPFAHNWELFPDDYALASIAAHEVRHRVQYELAWRTLPKPQCVTLRKAFHERNERLRAIIKRDYANYSRMSQLEELDATFIGTYFEELLYKAFPRRDQTIETEHLAEVLREHWNLFFWKNVHLGRKV